MSTPTRSIHIDPHAPQGSSLGAEWNRWLLPGSSIEQGDGVWRFANEPTPEGKYTDAQLDDYQGLRRRDFHWRPPLTLTVRARFSHEADQLVGTAGFGFWNDPFMMTGSRAPSLPRVIWFFFASPPSDMPLASGVPGRGWKAATLDAIRLPFLLMAPTAPLAVPLMNIPAVRRALWPVGQRAIGVSEALVSAPMVEWHTYKIDWGRQRAVFSVDGETILDCDTPPGGPLGLVLWIDNQAMVATPWGRFGWQALEIRQRQWLEISELHIANSAQS